MTDMVVKYYRDRNGNYMGAWAFPKNTNTPIGIPHDAIEVNNAPAKAWYKWNNQEQRWPRENEVELTNEEKQIRYLEAAPIHEQLEALIDNENQRPKKLEILKAKLQQVKQSFLTTK